MCHGLRRPAGERQRPGPPPSARSRGNASARLTSDAVTGDYFDNGSIAASVSHRHRGSCCSTTSMPARTRGIGPWCGRDVHRSAAVHVPLQPAQHSADPLRGARRAVHATGAAPRSCQQRVPGTARPRYCRRRTARASHHGERRLRAPAPREHRIGHLRMRCSRSSRAANGTPLHIRIDGPGFDAMDVLACRTFPGRTGPTSPRAAASSSCSSLIYVPTGRFLFADAHQPGLAGLRRRVPGGPEQRNGLERLITATRRQNFLARRACTGPFPCVDPSIMCQT